MDKEKEAVSFLESDFNQCFEQMRYYDTQIFEILKFITTIYTAIIGLSIGAYQYGLEKSIDFTLAIVYSLAVCICFGIFFLMLCVRNRVYFVHVTRYLNEIRQVFLEQKPLGIRNKSRMYIDENQPPFFNFRSSQIFFIYVISLANSILFGLVFYVLAKRVLILESLCILIMQICVSSIYLKSRERKSASKSVFGKEEIKL